MLLCVTGENTPTSGNATLIGTFLWPTDEAWAVFFEGIGLSLDTLKQLTVAEAAPVELLETLFSFHSLPYGLTTANMTNISTAALPEGVVVNESIPYFDSTGRLRSELANVIVGLPTTLEFDEGPARLDVAHNVKLPMIRLLDENLRKGGDTLFIGPEKANFSGGANNSAASAAASAVVEDLGLNTANVLFADVPGPNGFVIHVIDKVLLPLSGSNQFLIDMFGLQSKLVADLTAAAAAGPDCIEDSEAGRCDPTFANIVLALRMKRLFMQYGMPFRGRLPAKQSAGIVP
jgi:hypothetical protein